MITTIELIEKIKRIDMMARCRMTCRANGENEVVIIDDKNRIAAVVSISGEIEQKYAGQKNLCGSLLKAAIKAAI